MGQIREVKIYGERNTGTNYLSELIKKNIQVKVLTGKAPLHIKIKEKLTSGPESTRDTYFQDSFADLLGWKHQKVDMADLMKLNKIDQVGFLCLVKNPYSWLLSFYRSPHHYEGDVVGGFQDFIMRTDLKVLARDNLSQTQISPVELWNQKNRSYFKLSQEQQTLQVKYEELVQAPNEIIEQIVARFDLELKGGGVTNILKSTKSDYKKSYQDYRSYYESEAWKEKFTPEIIRIVNNQLDTELALNLGYKLL